MHKKQIKHTNEENMLHIWSRRPPSLKKDNGIWSDYGRLDLDIATMEVSCQVVVGWVVSVRRICPTDGLRGL